MGYFNSFKAVKGNKKIKNVWQKKQINIQD